MTGRRDARGFTLLEVMIAVSILGVMLAVIGNASMTTGAAADRHGTDAEAATTARRHVQKLAGFVRPIKWSEVRAQAVTADVNAGRATAVGEWIGASARVAREGVEFGVQVGTGRIYGGLDSVTRRVTYELDAGEIDNGLDDDGDGLIDEGSLRLEQDGVTVARLGHLEGFEHEMDGRVLTLRLRVALLDGRKEPHRAFVEQRLHARNN